MTPTEKSKLVDDLKSAMRGDPELCERVVVAALNTANGRTNDERELALKLFRVLANVVWHTEPPSAGRYGDFAFGEVLDLLDLKYAGTFLMTELRARLDKARMVPLTASFQPASHAVMSQVLLELIGRALVPLSRAPEVPPPTGPRRAKGRCPRKRRCEGCSTCKLAS